MRCLHSKMAADMYQTVRDRRIVSSAVSDDDDEDELEFLREAALRTMSKTKNSEHSAPEITREIEMDESFVEQEDDFSSTSTEYEDISLNSPETDKRFAESSEEKDSESDNIASEWIIERNIETRKLIGKQQHREKVESLTITVENNGESDDEDEADSYEDDHIPVSYLGEDNSNSEREDSVIIEGTVDSEEMSHEDSDNMPDDENASEEETFVETEQQEQQEELDEDDKEGEVEVEYNIHDDGELKEKAIVTHKCNYSVKTEESKDNDHVERLFHQPQENVDKTCESDSLEVEAATFHNSSSQKPLKGISKSSKVESSNVEAASKSSLEKPKVPLTKDKDQEKGVVKSSKTLEMRHDKEIEINTQKTVERIKKVKNMSPTKPNKEDLHTDQLSIGGSTSESCDEFQEQAEKKHLKSKVEYKRIPSRENNHCEKPFYRTQSKSKSQSRSRSYPSSHGYKGQERKWQRSRSSYERNGGNMHRPSRSRSRQTQNRSPNKNLWSTRQSRSKSPLRNRGPLMKRNRSPSSPRRNGRFNRGILSPIHRRIPSKRCRSPSRDRRVQSSRGPLLSGNRSPSSPRRKRRFNRISLSPQQSRSPSKTSRSPTFTHKSSRSPIRANKTLLKRNISARSRSPIKRTKSPTSRNQTSSRRSTSPAKEYQKTSERRSRQHESNSKDRINESVKSRLGTKDYDKISDKSPLSTRSQRGRSPPRGSSSPSRAKSSPSTTKSPLVDKSPQKSAPKQTIQKVLVKEKKGKTQNSLVAQSEKEKTLLNQSDGTNLSKTKKALPVTQKVTAVYSKENKNIIKSELNNEEEKLGSKITGDLRKIIRKTDAKEPSDPQDSKEKELDERIAKIRLKNLDILKRNMEIQKEKELFG